MYERKLRRYWAADAFFALVSDKTCPVWPLCQSYELFDKFEAIGVGYFAAVLADFLWVVQTRYNAMIVVSKYVIDLFLISETS